ncbi:MAG: hypothetical protein HZB42_07240 [Sphingobacteriales bacterium]|nr:hypothetical protein [Sphingobacteriales bacterium]
MKRLLSPSVLLLLNPLSTPAQENFSGVFSLGSRNTISMFNDDKAVGKGIGGQFRIQVGPKMNTEWYLDYITSKNKPYTLRNDYHIGWSVLLYSSANCSFDRLMQPYLIVGHCFDLSKVSELQKRSNSVSRLSMATQAGLGTHINITQTLDCSLSGQYMIHFGKDIETAIDKGEVVIEKKDFSTPDGHFLFTISFNYKFFRLWSKDR